MSLVSIHQKIPLLVNGTLSITLDLWNRIHIHTHTNFRFGEREREREKNREDSASLLGRRSNRQTRLVSLITTDEAREWHTESRG